tara:strand:- start:179 stop:622 length:444 start_codon:yes stop_codon:yes gene_type:complete
MNYNFSELNDTMTSSCQRLFKLKFTIGAIVTGIAAIVLTIFAVKLFIKPGSVKVSKCMTIQQRMDYNQQNPNKPLGPNDYGNPRNDINCTGTSNYYNVPTKSYFPGIICAFFAVACGIGAFVSWFTRNNKARQMSSCLKNMRPTIFV